MGLGLRRRLADVLDRTGLVRAVLEVRSRGLSPWLTVLTYHRVAPRGGGSFDEGVIDATPEEFDAQVGLFKRYFSLVSIDDVRSFVNGGVNGRQAGGARGGGLPPNPLLLTFDDGYRDNHAAALPILARHGARATFFIATRFVTERRIFWWDRINYLLKSSPRDRIEIGFPRRIELQLRGDVAGCTKKLLHLVKSHQDLDVDRFLDELTDAAGVPWSREIERKLADELVMTWDEVRALRDAGQDVQSHTRSHRVLQTLSREALDDELAGSRADLERELGGKISAVAYPVGLPNTPMIRAALEAAGYELGFSNASGINPTWKRPDRFDLRRIAVDGEMPSSHFRGILAIPALVSTAPLIPTDLHY